MSGQTNGNIKFNLALTNFHPLYVKLIAVTECNMTISFEHFVLMFEDPLLSFDCLIFHF